jgi:hypothetical protein
MEVEKGITYKRQKERKRPGSLMDDGGGIRHAQCLDNIPGAMTGTDRRRPEGSGW